MRANETSLSPCLSKIIRLYREEAHPLLQFSAKFVAPVNAAAAQKIEKTLTELGGGSHDVSLELIGVHLQAFKTAVRQVFVERPVGGNSNEWEKRARSYPKVLSILLRCEAGVFFTATEKETMRSLVQPPSLRTASFSGKFRPRPDKARPHRAPQHSSIATPQRNSRPTTPPSHRR